MLLQVRNYFRYPSCQILASTVVSRTLLHLMEVHSKISVVGKNLYHSLYVVPWTCAAMILSRFLLNNLWIVLFRSFGVPGGH